MGSSRQSHGCGTKNNVSYSLSAASIPVLQIKGRGFTGTCEPNIFDAMTATLASRFTQLRAVSSPPPE